ncbi:SpoIIE family protein phosphatase [candidate division KSB1 bacterium]|nr:SpoIIE family protein phosphatase [candidate division KSB1 bacterium]
MNHDDIVQPVEDRDDNLSRKLDEKLMELHSLFEVSQTLNSSLNVNAIIDNILLTSMGKMMISKGIVMLHDHDDIYKVETAKGLSRELIGSTLRIESSLQEPMFLSDIENTTAEFKSFFADHSIHMIIPIRSNNQMLGIIGFGAKILKTPYVQSEINFLNSLSNIAATSIENGLMVLELQDVNRRLDKKVQELNTLFDIGKELNSTLDKDKILNLLSYAIMGEMTVNRCLIFIDENNTMKLAISKGHRTEADLKVYENVDLLTDLGRVKESLILDESFEANGGLTLLKQQGFKVIVPMQIKDETRGIIVIGEKILKTEFNTDDIEFLYTLGNEAVICLENARLFEETLEKQRIEEELDIAREIQSRLLPQTCPTAPGFEIAAMNIPSTQVGGDYFDCIELADNNVCLAIADVSGKGIPASLLMSNLQASLQAIVDAHSNLRDVAFKINNLIYQHTGHDRFITFFFGMLHIKDRTFSYVNAGHNPPLWYRSLEKSIKELEKGGLILGMMKNVPFQQGDIRLVTGDWIIMYTDGVSEAMNEKDEEFGEDRIKEIILNHLEASAEEMKERIFSAIKSFTRGVNQSDDITMLIIKVL